MGVYLLLSCLLATISASRAQDEPRVDYLLPKIGSTGGGQRITIYGANFAKNQFNFPEAYAHLGNQVTFVNGHHEYVCDVHKDGCTETQIMCYTRRMPHGDYFVRVFVDGVALPVDKHCNHYAGTNHHHCKLMVWTSRTPSIEYVAPNTGLPGEVVTLRGRLYTNAYGSNAPISSNGKTCQIKRVWAGSQKCELYKDKLTSTFHRLELDRDGTSDNGWMACVIEGRYIGNTNMSFLVDGDYGRSIPYREAYWLTATNEWTVYQAYANVSAVSPSTGSTEGGAIMTVTGEHFDPHALTEVNVGGASCDVIAITDTEITCTLPAEPVTASNAGNRGMFMDVYEFIPTTTDFTTIDFNAINASWSMWIDAANYSESWVDDLYGTNLYVLRARGYFVPPLTARYQFYAQADDIVQLKFNENGEDPAGAVPIANASYPQSNSDYDDDNQASSVMSLTAGQRYYIEVIHHEHYGGAKWQVAARLLDTEYTERSAGPAYNHQQTLKLESTVVNEIQQLDLSGFAADSRVQEVQTVSVAALGGADPSFGKFRLGMHHVYTGPLAGDIDEAGLKSAIEDLPCVYPDKVSVTATGGSSFDIEFISDKGDFPEFDVIDFHDTDNETFPDLDITVTETTKGVSSGSYIQLTYKIPSTYRIQANDVDEDEIAKAVEDMFQVHCPRTITEPDRVGNNMGMEIGIRNDYEDEDRGDIPFCGTGALKLPSNGVVFNLDENIDLMDTPHLCFAHNGQLNGYVYVRYEYLENGADEFTAPHVWGVNHAYDIMNSGSGWNYNCINILTYFESVRGSDHQYVKLRKAAIYRNSNVESVYVDELAIVEKKIVEDDEREAFVNLRRMVPDTFELDEVDVTDIGNNTYNISFEVKNCYDNFEAMTVNNGGTISRAQEASPPVTGTYNLSYRSKELADIDISLQGHELRSILEPFFNEGEIKVTQTGQCHDYEWEIEWATQGGDKPPITISSTTLAGSNPSLSIETTQRGGVMLDPIPGDMLQTYNEQPQVSVVINHVPSKCTGDCNFEWSVDATPTITGVVPTSGPGGSDITISGTGLSTSTSDYDITINGVACSAQGSPTSTTVICTVGEGFGTADVVLVIADKGIVKHDGSGPYQFTYDHSISSISPTTGSTAGGSLLTVAGSGFGSGTTVSVDGNSCSVQSADYTSIVCVTPPGSDGTVGSVVVTQGGSPVTSGTSFTYDTAQTPIITSISPGNTASVKGNTTLTITGTGFGDSSVDTVVSVNSVEASINSKSDTEIQVALPIVDQGSYPLHVYIDGKGYADTSTNAIQDITYTFEVTQVFPTMGSMEGGTRMTIIGEGFDDSDPSIHSALFGDTECAVESVTSTRIECMMGRPGVVHKVTNQGEHSYLGKGYAWEPMTVKAKVGDFIHWKWNISPSVDGIQYTVQQIANLLSNESLSGGINCNGGVGTPIGECLYEVTTAQTMFYWSGWVDNTERLSLKGIINIDDREDFAENLVLTIGDIEAEHVTGGSPSDPSDASSCTPETDVTSCSSPTNPDVSKFSFGFVDCLTPKITALSPNSGATDEDIIIDGSGFLTTTCQDELMFGDFSCAVVAGATSSQMTCQLNTSSADIPVGKPLPLESRMWNRGYGRMELDGTEERAFTVTPVISSISSTRGSTNGGTKLTVSGTGLCSECAGSQPDNVQVTVGSNLCEVESATFTEVVCIIQDNPVGASGDVVTHVLGYRNEMYDSACANNCTFTFDSSLTPTVSSISPSSIAVTTSTITINGTLLGTDTSDLAIYVGSATCIPITATDTMVECSPDSPIAGNQPFSLTVHSKGTSTSSVSTITVEPSISNISPAIGSIEGGLPITITGFGFENGDTTVVISSSECDITTVTNTEIICVTPSIAEGVETVSVTSNTVAYPDSSFEFSAAETPTVSSVSPTSGTVGNTLTITGTGFGTGIAVVQVDDKECTSLSVTDTTITCTLAASPAGQYSVSINVDGKGLASGSVSFTYELVVSSVSPVEGSFAGGQNLTLTGNGFSTDTSVTVCGNNCTLISTSNPSEYICRTPSNDGSDPNTCDVVVEDGSTTVTAADGYTYRSSLTPTISNVDPRRGGTAGGKDITISGTGFGSSVSDVLVTIDGVECIVDSGSFTSTNIVCDTGAHKPSIQSTVEVSIGTQGVAQEDVSGESGSFEYIDVWSSNFSWGGGPTPQEGDFVVIPKDMKILLDEDTPVLKMLLIQGGQLIFDEVDVELKAEYILIVNGGLLQVGTEEEPFQHDATITLHGHPRSKELPIYGAKMIALRDGTIDLHGKPRGITWTQLGATADAGSSTIILNEPVGWEAGDEIIIASTGTRHTQIENEQHTIAAIAVDNVTITLASPLEYTHLGESVTVSDTQILEARAEVGLLTHNIKFRGSDNMQWHDKIEACEAGFDTGEFATQTCFQGRFGEEQGADEFGAHIIIHQPALNAGLVTARIERVELNYVGQAFRLGRYAIHFHLNGDMSGSYVKECGIHKSFNRAVNIHNTQNLLVERNVVFNIMGGAFFLEDGIETGNTWQYNLAIFVKASTSLQNDDITPAAFWITNPNNTVQHNHAAGGSHFGFWFRMHAHPDGPSFTSTICPRKVPLGVFYNNTVHTQGWFGVWVFQTWTPMVGGSCSSNTPEPAILENFKAWNCEKGFESVNTGAIQVKDFLLVHNEKAGFEFKQLTGVVPFDATKTAMVFDSTVAASAGVLTGANTSAGIILPLTSGLIVKTTNFVNFNDDGKAAFRFTKIDGKSGGNNGGFRYHLSELTYTDSSNIVFFKWESEGLLHDLDGSTTGITNGKILPMSGVLNPSKCTEDAKYSVNMPGAICDGDTDFHRFAWGFYAPKSLEGQNVLFTNSYGVAIARYEPKRMTHKPGWMVLLPTSDTYDMQYEYGYQISNISYRGRIYDLKVDQYIIIEHNFTQSTPDMFQITDMRNESSTALSLATNTYGDWTFDKSAAWLAYMVTGKDESSLSYIDATDRDINFKVYKCYYEGCITPVDPGDVVAQSSRPGDYVPWSSSTKWFQDDEGFWYPNKTDDGGSAFPTTNGVDVAIKADTWVVLDTESLPDLGVVKIEETGVLEFEGAAKPSSRKRRSAGHYDLTITCDHLIIYSPGRLIIGTEEEPFLGQARIILSGDHFSPEYAINSGPNVGGKAIGVFGMLDLHGEDKLSWTQLAAPITAGDTSFSVMDEPTNWNVGDEVVISSTSYNTTEFEVRNITAISGKIITVEAFEFDHAATNITVGSQTHIMAAKVGMLSRNIKIIGEHYPQQIDQAFGARVLVGKVPVGDNELIGSARLSNVEFTYTGQDGWSDFYDPRYSLSFLDIGEVTTARPSYVHNCAFNFGFAPGIGVYGTENLNVTSNVIFRPVGSGVIAWGQGTALRNNLVVNLVHYGTYHDRNVKKDHWEAGFELHKGSELQVHGNVVAGSERGAFRTDGQLCGIDISERWTGNEIHSALVGVYLLPDELDGTSPCTLLTGFMAWKNYDFGFYVQTPFSVEMDGIVSIANGQGVHPMIIGPGATGHAAEDKTFTISNSHFVGLSGLDDCGGLDSANKNMVNSAAGRGLRAANGGLVGVVWPTFASGSNKAPRKPWAGLMSYQAINGLLTFQGCTFSNFNNYTCANSVVRKSVALMGHPKQDDCQHPVRINNTALYNVHLANKVFLPRPNVGKINPADCVDMDCDALKKNLLDDIDGTFLGKGISTSVHAESEYEWDGDPRRGYGDYRIPKTMLTELDGSRIPVENIVTAGRGIIRDDNCTYEVEYQGWVCTDLDYEMLHLESMDADTETRRVSPVAILGDGYIDLINGPQDHGWCSGYTCQKRLSLFPIIVAMGKYYELHYSGTTPQKQRLHLLNANAEQSFVISIWYAQPWRLDIFVDGEYVLPMNGYYLDNGQIEYNKPVSINEFRPDAVTDEDGANYFDRDTGLLSVKVGMGIIDIRTVDMIIVTFNIPAMTVDEFFGENIINNLAMFLNIAPEKIKVATAVKETRRRRKRETTLESEVTVEISNPPPTSNATAPDITSDEMMSISETIFDEYQTGDLASILDVAEILDIVVLEPPPPSDSDEWNDLAINEKPIAVVIQKPSTMVIDQQPPRGVAGAHFSTQPKLSIKDTDGNTIQQLGSTMKPWLLKTTLRYMGGNFENEVYLTYTSNLPYKNGAFEFQSLGISHDGRYILDFEVVYPSSAVGYKLSSNTIIIDEGDVDGADIDQPGSTDTDGEFDVSVTIDGDKDDWDCSVALHMPEIYYGKLNDDVKVEVDPKTHKATFSNLHISEPGRYYLRFTCKSKITNDAYSFIGDPIDVFPPGYIPPVPNVQKEVKLRFNVSYDDVVAGQEDYFAAMLYNKLFNPLSINVTYDNFIIERGSIIATFTVVGASITEVEKGLQHVHNEVKNGLGSSFNGYQVTSDKEMHVDGEAYYGVETADTSLHPGVIAAIVIVVLIVVFFIIFVPIYLLKCHNKGKFTSSGNVNPSPESPMKKNITQFATEEEGPSTSEDAGSTSSSHSGNTDTKLIDERTQNYKYKSPKGSPTKSSNGGSPAHSVTSGASPSKSGTEKEFPSHTSIQYEKTGMVTSPPLNQGKKTSSDYGLDNLSVPSLRSPPPPSPDLLYPPLLNAVKKKNGKKHVKNHGNSDNNSDTSAESSLSSNVSLGTRYYGNTRPVSPADLLDDIKFCPSPVSPHRHNGPMVSTNVRRNSIEIPCDFKMPGAD